MAVEELTLRSATELSALLTSGEVSSVELTQAFIDRARRYERLNAYITLDAEGALRQAQAADEEMARGAVRGPLHGLPVALKDQFDAKGLRTTVGSTIVDYIADKDATVVARLREAGAVILGKLNLSEFALGGNVTHPYGVPHNPWDETRQAGQSSSGPGIAVAASLCAAALGGDTAGSIRGPSAWCGITGLRPTWGRVSRNGAFPMAWFMDTIGPMTKTVEDTAMIFQAIAGHDPKDANTSERTLTPFEARESLEGLRVGLVRESIDNGMASDAVATSVREAMAQLEAAGATVVDASLPLFEHGGLISNGLSDAEAAHTHRAWLRERPQDYDFASRRRLMAASLMSATTYVKLSKLRMLMRRDVMAALDKVDVLVTPAQAETAPKIATATGLTSKEAVIRQFFGLRAHRGPFNLSGVPAMAVPCGFSTDGLPFSMQLVGRPFEENTLFQVGHAYQQRTDWHERRPDLA
jgi:aspartyl-tRNA(Asn)/glutamyl-tRNA(Gln) amidotransferase subunit A